MTKSLPAWLCLAAALCVSVAALARQSDREVRAALEDRYEGWLAAENRRDAAMITSFYDDDAVLLPGKEEPVVGKPAIGQYYKMLVANPQFVPFTLVLDWNSFHLAGDIAITTALFNGELARNDKAIHFRGKLLLVWKRQKDGTWKIYRYMYDEIPAKK